MDLSNYDLQGLQIIFDSLRNVILTHKNQLSKITDNSSTSELSSNILNQKIKIFETELDLVEIQIKRLAADKLRFSVEYLFKNFGFLERSIQIHFIVTSEAYKKYGKYVTGLIHYEESELILMIEGMTKNTWSDGRIKFIETVSEKMLPETKIELKKTGFLVSEIYTIS
jgi:hypothetical protein